MKTVVKVSMGVAGLVAVLALLDLLLGVPFGGGAIGGKGMVMDAMFILGAGLVGYMGWDSLKDMR